VPDLHAVDEALLDLRGDDLWVGHVGMLADAEIPDFAFLLQPIESAVGAALLLHLLDSLPAEVAAHDIVVTQPVALERLRAQAVPGQLAQLVRHRLRRLSALGGGERAAGQGRADHPGPRRGRSKRPHELAPAQVSPRTYLVPFIRSHGFWFSFLKPRSIQ